MSSDEPPAILIKWCKERTGIRLKKDYLKDWYRSRTTPILNTEIAYRELLADFMKTDIATTSEPIIQPNFGELPVETFPTGHLRQGGGVVLQIQDTMDISNSTLSLLNALDNLTPVRQTYTERSENDPVELPRGLLRWTLTDGSKQIQAMELETIESLNLKTPFGSKILIDNCQLRRGMLILCKNNVKLLGGDVPELYGGDMKTELKKRFKMKLGILEEPETPTPNRSYTAQEDSTFNRTFTSEENSMSGRTFVGEGNSTFDRTFVNTPVTTESLVNEIEEYGDDDLYYNDSIFDYEDMDVDNITPHIPAHEIINGNVDDDDFMEPLTYKPPAKSSPVKISLSKSSTRSTQKQQPTNHTQQLSPTTIDNTQVGSKSKKKDDNYKKQDIHDMEEDLDDDLSWVDPSLWENLNRMEKMDMEIDKNGRAHCSFEELKKTLKAMETGSFVGDLPDIVFVKIRCQNLGRFSMTPSGKFHMEMWISGPEEPHDLENAKSDKFKGVKVVFRDELLQQLLGVKKDELVDMNKNLGSKYVTRRVFIPFQKRVLAQLADVEIDLTILESESSRGIDSKAFLPLLTNFTLCS